MFIKLNQISLIRIKIHNFEAMIMFCGHKLEFVKRALFKRKNNAPRKVLPPSPINTFEGYQFHNRNANKDPTNIKKELDINIEPRAKIKTIEPDTNPSIPSIKFMRLIIVVPMINKNINKSRIKYFSNSPKLWIN